MDKNIKDYREKELKGYVIGNILIILFLSNLLNMLNNFSEIYKDQLEIIVKIINQLISVGLFSTVIYSYVYIIDSIIGWEFKSNICHLWIMKYPGETIFDEIEDNCKDIRFTSQEAKKKYEDIYKKLKKANSCKNRRKLSNSYWNGIFKNHQYDTKIMASHRDYLLCRDMCVLTICIVIIYIIMYLLGAIVFSCQIVCFLSIEWVLTLIATRFKEKRFAYNVIDVDLKTENNTNNNIKILN